MDRIDVVCSRIKSFPNNRTIESNQDWNCCYKDVKNSDLGYLHMMDYTDFRDRMYDRYNMNHYKSDLENKDEYLKFHKILMKRYENSPSVRLDLSPSERPDFEIGTIWYVDDEPGEGPDNPPENYINIQNAINAADHGDTVYVYKGLYQENVFVNKSIKLLGQKKETTIIDGGENDKDVIHIESNFVSITGLKIQNGKAGIRIKYSSENTIMDNIVANNIYDGIRLAYSKDAVIKDNELFSNGITIWGDCLAFWNSHIIENNSANGKCIRYYHDDENIIVPKDSAQVIMVECQDMCIQHCNFSNIDKSIQLGYSKNISVTNNKIENNNDNGIFLYNSSNNIIYQNNLSNNLYFGIRLIESSGCLVYENTVKGSVIGILIQYSSKNNNVERNTIIKNIDGIIIDYFSNKNIIKSNICTMNDIDGIGLSEGSCSNTIVSNNCSDNLKGIAIRSPKNLIPSSNNDINNNICNFNQEGILINGGFYNRISGNIAKKNNVGIYLYSSTMNTLRFNIVNYNNHKGVVLRRISVFNTIHDNQIGPLNYQGLYLEKSYFNSMNYNSITSNNNDGIGLIQTFGNKINNNNIIDNTEHAIEGTLCFDNACNNYWGKEPPKRWLFTNEEDADIYTPGGFVAIQPYLRNPVNLDNQIS